MYFSVEAKYQSTDIVWVLINIPDYFFFYFKIQLQREFKVNGM